MPHLRTITRPASAQFESLMQFVGLLNALLALFVNFANTFGIPIPNKGAGGR